MINTFRELLGKEVQIQPLVGGGFMISMPPYFGAMCHKIIEIEGERFTAESQRHSPDKRPITKTYKFRLIRIISQEGVLCKMNTRLPESFFSSSWP